MGRGWRVVRNKQEKQAALPAILRQALQAVSPRSTQQTTQSLEARFMPVPSGCLLLFLFAGAALLLCGAVQLLTRGVRVIFKKSPTQLDRAKKKKKKNDQGNDQ